MAGRKISKDTVRIVKILKKRVKHIFVDNNLLPPSSIVWQTLRDNYKIKKTTKAIYTIATKNKSKILKKPKSNTVDLLPLSSSLHIAGLNNSIGSDSASENSNKTAEYSPLLSNNTDDLNSDLNGSFDSNSAKSESSNSFTDSKIPIIRFKTSISRKNWLLILPRPAENTKRKRLSLASGIWASVLARQIAEKNKSIKCRFKFKYCTVNPNGDWYIVVLGQCSICEAKLTGRVKSEPDNDEGITLQFELSNYDEKIHKSDTNPKKVKLNGEEAKRIYSAKMPASTQNRFLAEENMEMFEFPSARIPSSNAIKQGRYRLNQQERLDNDPLRSLSLMQLSSNCIEIRSLAINPFYVIYISNEQLQLYHEYKRRCKYTKVSCDATGSIVKKLGNYFNHFFPRIISFCLSSTYLCNAI